MSWWVVNIQHPVGVNSQTAAVTERRNQCHLPETSDGCGRGEDGEEVEMEMEGGVAHGLLPWR